MAKISRRVIARTIAEKLLREPAKKAELLRSTAAYLIENNLTDDVDLLVNDIAAELFKQSGTLSARVESARPLTDTIRTSLAASLKEQTGAHKVVLSEHVDPELVGGLIARTPDAELDLSVRTKLRQLATIK